MRDSLRKTYTITVTVLLEKGLWIGLFERNDSEGYALARKVFGSEPRDAELYDFILTHYHELKFSDPANIQLVIKRKNPKRVQREVRQFMEKAKQGLPSMTHAQEVLKLEQEKNKKIKKTKSKAEKEARVEAQFLLKQAKRKKKHQGH